MRPLWIALLLTLTVPAWGQEGRYRIEAADAAPSRGSAEVRRDGARWTVAIRTFLRGDERRFRAPAAFADERLLFESVSERLNVSLRPLGRGSLLATYVDRRGAVVRRERWVPTRAAHVPVAIVTLAGGATFPGVSPAQARATKTWIEAQLEAVYAPLGIRFFSLAATPVELPGAAFDDDGDGRLSRAEIEAVRDELERRGIKRPGRVVLVVTAGAFVHGACRGWTLGDAPASPDTLSDPNDNFSLVGLRYLDPTRFHTVAHEVGHQLGLDDVGPRNRRLLHEPHRDDHLMISGGTGLHVDPAPRSLLTRTVVQRFPDHGLEGRAEALPPVAVGAGAGAAREPAGLPVPAAPRSSRIDARKAD